MTANDSPRRIAHRGLFMNLRTGFDCLARWIGVLAIVLIVPSAKAEETQGYGFAAAAQELSQLLWLAETANACGWANREEVLKFERFSLRFLAAHLSEQNVKALVNLVRAEGYESAVRRVAQEGSSENCGTARWHNGWLAYKAAADEHERDF